MKPTPKRNFDPLIDTELDMIAYFRKYGCIREEQVAKDRLQQWYRLQAEQEGKR